MKKEYITEEERQKFREGIPDYLEPKHKDKPGVQPSSKLTMFYADKNIKIDQGSDPHSDDEFKLAGLQTAKMLKLKSGKFNIDARLDIHGMNVEQARVSLSEFINDAYHNHQLCVMIIHGKGLHKSSTDAHRIKDFAKLKKYVIAWLRNNADTVVLAFCPAPPEDGGKGATYVLLSNKKD